MKNRTVLEIAQAGLHRTEHVEQKFLVERLALMEARHPELKLLYAVPNGGYRHKATAGKMKAEGLKPSVPDLVLPVPRWPFHGLYVEMKQVGKYGSPEQRAFQRSLLAHGYAVFECQGEEAAFPVIMGYLSLHLWIDHGRIPTNDEIARTLRHVAGFVRGVTTTLKPTEGTAHP